MKKILTYAKPLREGWAVKVGRKPTEILFVSPSGDCFTLCQEGEAADLTIDLSGRGRGNARLKLVPSSRRHK